MRTERLRCVLGTPARWSADYLIALIPVYCWSLFAFGAWQTHLQLATSLVASIVFVLAVLLAQRKTVTHYHLLTTFVFGFALGFLMPAGVPMWYAVISAFLAGTVWYLPKVGGYTKKYVHPVAFALTITAILFPIASKGGSALLSSADQTRSFYDLLLGRHGGRIGEVSALMILIGGSYLVIRRVIDWQTPVCMIGAVALLSYLFPIAGTRTEYLLTQLLTGGVVFTAVYLLPFFSRRFYDTAKWIYGAAVGALTYVFRSCFPNIDGVYPALLLATLVMCLIGERLSAKACVWQGEF